MMLKYVKCCLLGITCLFGFEPLNGQEGVIVLPSIIRNNEGVTAIAVESSRTDLATIGKRAFNLHGAFRNTDAKQAAYVVQLEPSGPQAVYLKVRSNGIAGANLLDERIGGEDPVKATLRACDRVVEFVSGQPGFFGGKLAFIGKRSGVSEVYTSDILFQSVRPLTADKALVTGPSWSPDGKQLLYTTYFKTGFPDIYLMDLEAGVRRAIANYKGTNTGGRFSPDGQKIAMVISGTSDTEICVSDASGKGLKRLTANKSLESGPSWSPDGEHLVFASDARGKPQLYTLSVQGGQLKRLPTRVSRFCTEPAWNPVNSDLIAFTASAGGRFQICIYDAALRKAHFITNGTSSAVEPVWLNDGRHIIYTKKSTKGTNLVLLDTKSKKEQNLHRSAFGSSSCASFVYP